MTPKPFTHKDALEIFLYLLLLLVVMWLMPSCGKGAQPICETRCGLAFQYLPPDGPWNCETLQEAEDASLHSFDVNITGDARQQFWNGCTRVHGVEMAVRDGSTWNSMVDPNDYRPVAGESYCGSNFAVGNVEWRKSAFTHELAHIILRCGVLSEPVPPEDYDHGGWAASGVWGAIDIARAP